MSIPRLDTAHGEAGWNSRPTTTREAAAKADAAVIATVTSVVDGAPKVAAPDEIDPTQLVTLSVR